MHYFMLKQDEQMRQVMEIEPRSGGDSREHGNLYVREHAGFAFTDWSDKPQRIVSDRVKRLLELYELELRSSTVILNAREAKRQELYWRIEPPERDLLSSASERDAMGIWRKIVLDAGKLALTRSKLFTAAGCCFVHLDVAESLLRRASTGFILVPANISRS
ncbi:hypothetical protein SAMN04487969_10516 [Paenibacillus algorifonticola]|uniref:Uncharacterized protein n=1 Tax=Paenibacillus algorifonticola TaxID=684063 RepID=A0A1I2CE67_9BACL|nr:hypothetical protein [Paenibacillus algorifonticola]SFE66415.1 hypothetical protein SAMN04487969_10516 [Paenibacillus algorifonticola]